MICTHCARGADLKSEMEAFLAAGSRRASIQMRITRAHGSCPGGNRCDCQHSGTKHARKAGHA